RPHRPSAGCGRGTPPRWRRGEIPPHRPCPEPCQDPSAGAERRSPRAGKFGIFRCRKDPSLVSAVMSVDAPNWALPRGGIGGGALAPAVADYFLSPVKFLA